MKSGNSKQKNANIKKLLLICVSLFLFSSAVSVAQITEVASRPLVSDQILISVNFDKTPLPVALKEISEKGNLGFSYQTESVPFRSVTYQAENVNVYQVLDSVLRGTQLHYKISGNRKVILIKKEPVATMVKQKKETVSGTVMDAQTGEPLIGVSILVVGTSNGTTTNVDGHYRLSVPSLQDSLRFSYIGYKTKTVSINGRMTIDVALESQAILGEELVVIGFGSESKSNITTSISSVKARDIKTSVTASVAGALQGRSSGVLVTQSSGAPGSGMNIRIRGASSLGNNNPLFVVDGIPIVSSSGTEFNVLATMDKNNIQSIQVLKGASAAAIYGSRAANGVVIITTKKGQSGNTQVQVSVKGGISKIPQSRWIDMMNTSQFHQFSVEAYKNAGLSLPPVWQEPYLSQNLKQNTNWQAALFKPGIIQNYNISVSGGSENATYFLGTGYLNREGNIVGNSFIRPSFTLNSQFFLVGNSSSPIVTVGENLKISQAKWIGQIGSGGDILAETLEQSPTVPLRNPNNIGGFAGPTKTTSPGFRLNQVAVLHLRDNNHKIKSMLGTAFIKYNIIPNLYYKLSLSADLRDGYTSNFTPPYDLESNVKADASLDQSSNYYRHIIINNTIHYDFSINNVNSFKLLGGFSREKITSHGISGTAKAFPNNQLRTINASTGTTTIQGGATASTMESYFGRLRYSYNNTYNIQLAIRRDGSSRFGSKNRWGTFPSVSGSWRIANESFMDDIDNVSQLTLRAGWGVTGSNRIPDFAAISVIQPIANYVFGINQQVAPGASVITVGNSRLKWQKTKEVDVGIDIGLWANSLTFSIDYYNKNTSNVLVKVPIATTSGIRRNNGAFQNIGKIQNSGFELSASYQHSMGDFSFDLSGNISTVNNEVKYLGVPNIIVNINRDAGGVQTITQPGSEVGDFYGYVTEGIFNNQQEIDNHAKQFGAYPGSIIFKDLNGDGVINVDDRKIIGSPFPDFYYGGAVNLNYKNIGISLLFDGVSGRDIYNIRGAKDTGGFNNVTTAYLNRWTPQNKDGTYPAPNYNKPADNLRSSTFWVENGSYLALRNLRISYDFSGKRLNNKFMQVNNLELFISIQNLGWITPYTGYNPEIGNTGSGNRAALVKSVDYGTYPLPRISTIGINVSF